MAGFKTKEQASAAGKKSKRKKSIKTVVKETLGEVAKNNPEVMRTYEETKEQMMKNMQDLIFSENEAMRLASLQYADYFHPKKKESSVKFEGVVNLVINPKLVANVKTDTDNTNGN